MKIADKMYVAIDYCLTLDSGEEVDRSAAGSPLTFITGNGQIIPGLEKELLGLKQGDTAQITVEPEDGYGQAKEDLFHEIPLDQFPADVEIEPGMGFQAQGPKGPFMFYVKSIDNGTVKADLNHPMAGKRLHFDVTVAEVREASSEELAKTTNGGGCGCGSTDPNDCGSGCNCG